MINSKNLFENFEEIPIEKAHPNISTESLIDKQLFLFQIPKNVFLLRINYLTNKIFCLV